MSMKPKIAARWPRQLVIRVARFLGVPIDLRYTSLR
jgi:hypothetical protein